MKLAFPEMQHVIEIKKGCVSSLIIENRQFMYRFLMDLYQQTEKMEGKAVLSINNEPIEIHKSMVLVTDFISFEMNRKSLLNKIYAELEKDAMSPEHVERTLQLLSELELFMNELSMDFDVELSCDKITMGSVIKAAGIHIIDDFEALAEKLITFMRLVREFEGDKLFVFVNLRSFISFEQLQQFTDTLILHDYRVLFLDNQDYPKLENELRLIIDEDLCEI